jgi:hypothetical protein
LKLKVCIKKFTNWGGGGGGSSKRIPNSKRIEKIEKKNDIYTLGMICKRLSVHTRINGVRVISDISRSLVYLYA